MKFLSKQLQVLLVLGGILLLGGGVVAISYSLNQRESVDAKKTSACTWVETNCGSGCADNKDLYNCKNPGKAYVDKKTVGSNPDSDKKAIEVAPPEVQEFIPGGTKPAEGGTGTAAGTAGGCGVWKAVCGNGASFIEGDCGVQGNFGDLDKWQKEACGARGGVTGGGIEAAGGPVQDAGSESCNFCGGAGQGGCDQNPTGKGFVCKFGCEGGLKFCNSTGSCQQSCPGGAEDEGVGPVSSNPVAAQEAFEKLSSQGGSSGAGGEEVKPLDVPIGSCYPPSANGGAGSGYPCACGVCLPLNTVVTCSQWCSGKKSLSAVAASIPTPTSAPVAQDCGSAAGQKCAGGLSCGASGTDVGDIKDANGKVTVKDGAVCSIRCEPDGAGGVKNVSLGCAPSGRVNAKSGLLDPRYSCSAQGGLCTAATCGDGTCGPGENDVACPNDCKAGVKAGTGTAEESTGKVDPNYVVVSTVEDARKKTAQIASQIARMDPDFIKSGAAGEVTETEIKSSSDLINQIALGNIPFEAVTKAYVSFVESKNPLAGPVNQAPVAISAKENYVNIICATKRDQCDTKEEVQALLGRDETMLRLLADAAVIEGFCQRFSTTPKPQAAYGGAKVSDRAMCEYGSSHISITNVGTTFTRDENGNLITTTTQEGLTTQGRSVAAIVTEQYAIKGFEALVKANYDGRPVPADIGDKWLEEYNKYRQAQIDQGLGNLTQKPELVCPGASTGNKTGRCSRVVLPLTEDQKEALALLDKYRDVEVYGQYVSNPGAFDEKAGAFLGGVSGTTISGKNGVASLEDFRDKIMPVIRMGQAGAATAVAQGTGITDKATFQILSQVDFSDPNFRNSPAFMALDRATQAKVIIYFDANKVEVMAKATEMAQGTLAVIENKDKSIDDFVAEANKTCATDPFAFLRPFCGATKDSNSGKVVLDKMESFCATDPGNPMCGEFKKVEDANKVVNPALIYAWNNHTEEESVGAICAEAGGKIANNPFCNRAVVNGKVSVEEAKAYCGEPSLFGKANCDKFAQLTTGFRQIDPFAGSVKQTILTEDYGCDRVTNPECNLKQSFIDANAKVISGGQASVGEVGFGYGVGQLPLFGGLVAGFTPTNIFSWVPTIMNYEQWGNAVDAYVFDGKFPGGIDCPPGMLPGACGAAVNNYNTFEAFSKPGNILSSMSGSKVGAFNQFSYEVQADLFDKSVQSCGIVDTASADQLRCMGAMGQASQILIGDEWHNKAVGTTVLVGTSVAGFGLGYIAQGANLAVNSARLAGTVADLTLIQRGALALNTAIPIVSKIPLLSSYSWGSLAITSLSAGAQTFGTGNWEEHKAEALNNLANSEPDNEYFKALAKKADEEAFAASLFEFGANFAMDAGFEALGNAAGRSLANAAVKNPGLARILSVITGGPIIPGTGGAGGSLVGGVPVPGGVGGGGAAVVAFDAISNDLGSVSRSKGNELLEVILPAVRDVGGEVRVISRGGQTVDEVFDWGNLLKPTNGYEFGGVLPDGNLKFFKGGEEILVELRGAGLDFDLVAHLNGVGPNVNRPKIVTEEMVGARIRDPQFNVTVDPNRVTSVEAARYRKAVSEALLEAVSDVGGTTELNGLNVTRGKLSEIVGDPTYELSGIYRSNARNQVELRYSKGGETFLVSLKDVSLGEDLLRKIFRNYDAVLSTTPLSEIAGGVGQSAESLVSAWGRGTNQPAIGGKSNYDIVKLESGATPEELLAGLNRGEFDGYFQSPNRDILSLRGDGEAQIGVYRKVGTTWEFDAGIGGGGIRLSDGDVLLPEGKVGVVDPELSNEAGGPVLARIDKSEINPEGSTSPWASGKPEYSDAKFLYKRPLLMDDRLGTQITTFRGKAIPESFNGESIAGYAARLDELFKGGEKPQGRLVIFDDEQIKVSYIVDNNGKALNQSYGDDGPDIVETLANCATNIFRGFPGGLLGLVIRPVLAEEGCPTYLGGERDMFDVLNERAEQLGFAPKKGENTIFEIKRAMELTEQMKLADSSNKGILDKQRQDIVNVLYRRFKQIGIDNGIEEGQAGREAAEAVQELINEALAAKRAGLDIKPPCLTAFSIDVFSAYAAGAQGANCLFIVNDLINGKILSDGVDGSIREELVNQIPTLIGSSRDGVPLYGRKAYDYLREVLSDVYIPKADEPWYTNLLREMVDIRIPDTTEELAGLVNNLEDLSPMSTQNYYGIFADPGNEARVFSDEINLLVEKPKFGAYDFVFGEENPNFNKVFYEVADQIDQSYKGGTQKVINALNEINPELAKNEKLVADLSLLQNIDETIAKRVWSEAAPGASAPPQWENVKKVFLQAKAEGKLLYFDDFFAEGCPANVCYFNSIWMEAEAARYGLDGRIMSFSNGAGINHAVFFFQDKLTGVRFIYDPSIGDFFEYFNYLDLYQAKNIKFEDVFSPKTQ